MVAAQLTAQAYNPASTIVGNFSAGDLSGWRKKSFKGATDYSLIQVDGRKVLRAHSVAAGSGLYKKVSIDLKRTPYINWSWRVDELPRDVDETSRNGDDYAARVYVVKSGGLLFWRTRALNYVWSSNQPAGATWPNAYTRNSTMLALERGRHKLGKWVSVKRDVRADLKRYLGRKIDTIDAIAIMTDTDNTGQTAVAYYGDIFFTSE